MMAKTREKCRLRLNSQAALLGWIVEFEANHKLLFFVGFTDTFLTC